MDQTTKAMWGRRGNMVLSAMIFGITAGAVAGLLLAPRAGKETRAQLREQAEAMGDSMKESSRDLFAKSKRQVDTAMQRGREAAETVRKSVQDVIEKAA